MKKGGKMIVLVWIGLCVMLAVIGQLFMKLGTKEVGGITIKKLASTEIFSLLFNRYIFLGMIAYFSGWLLWLVVLSQAELSYAYPFFALSYAIIAIISWLFLKETMTLVKASGILLIMVGAILLNLK
ncbi:MAG: EamA family transporter [Candidatus Aenigmarchaeota archaeon]|nr:EamA family transporter [Candidatus Aenigmarchaeota archaeon]